MLYFDQQKTCPNYNAPLVHLIIKGDKLLKHNGIILNSSTGRIQKNNSYNLYVTTFFILTNLDIPKAMDIES